jgi:hypothetical protein
MQQKMRSWTTIILKANSLMGSSEDRQTELRVNINGVSLNQAIRISEKRNYSNDAGPSDIVLKGENGLGFIFHKRVILNEGAKKNYSI